MNARRRFGAIAGAAVLSTGLAVGATVALPGSASAAACTNSVGLLTTNCTSTGTVTLNAGILSMGGPANLAWTGAVTGATQTLYDTSANDQTLYVADLRGLVTGAGWNMTATATAFTGTATTGNATLPATGVLAVNGAASGTGTLPTATCAVALACTLPVSPGSAITYPVSVPTATGPPAGVKVYNANTGSGTGLINISPAIWSVTLPAQTAADTYTSTVTLSVVTGPLSASAAGRPAGGHRLRRPANRSVAARKRGGTL